VNAGSHREERLVARLSERADRESAESQGDLLVTQPSQLSLLPPARRRGKTATKPRTATSQPGEPTVVQQVRTALRPGNRLATSLGFLLGGFVPLASFFVAHYEVTRMAPWYEQKPVFLVLGGLAYSARTVWQWGRLAFQNAVKALGFVVLLEGVMVTSHIPWLSIAALAYLIAINGVATGCHLTSKSPR
jgi:hypothetical protein